MLIKATVICKVHYIICVINLLNKSTSEWQKNKTSSNQRLGECVRPKMESGVVAKEQGCWQTMPFNMPQMER